MNLQSEASAPPASPCADRLSHKPKGVSFMPAPANLPLFLGMIRTIYPLFHWRYDQGGAMLSAEKSTPLSRANVFTQFGFSAALLPWAAAPSPLPVLLDTGLGLLWIAAAEQKTAHIHLLGPSFTGSRSVLEIIRSLEGLSLPLQMRRSLEKNLQDVPLIPSSSLSHLAVMFHYALNEEALSPVQVKTLSSLPLSPAEDVSLIFAEHRGVWAAERQFLQMIREGNPAYQKALERSMVLSSGVRSQLKSHLRSAKNNLHVLLTLCSRAAIEGGLSPSVSYSLNDLYAARIEESKSLSELTGLSSLLLQDYVGRVAQSKRSQGISASVLHTCHYISDHLHEPLTLPDLARRAGYSPAYFSRLFTREIGISLSAYIRAERMKKARLLLTDSALSLEDIQSEIGISSRSQFFKDFKDYSGLSPRRYREKGPDFR